MATTHETKSETGRWAELVSGKEKFLAIVRMLVSYDECMNRFTEWGDLVSHFMRKAVSLDEPEHLRVFIRHLGDFRYFVVVELNAPDGHVSTFWIHEDGIRAEREKLKQRKSHPVHGILCMTDLFEQNSRPLPSDPDAIGVEGPTLRLLNDALIEDTAIQEEDQ